MRSSLLILLLLFLSPLSFALTSDKTKPTLIDSDKAQLNYLTGMATYMDNATATQGSTELKGDMIVVHVDEGHEVTKIIALGSDKNLAHYSTLTNPKKPKVRATARQIFYYPTRDKVILEDNATVNQQPNTISGPYLIYNTASQTVEARPGYNERTTILSHPSQRQKPAKENKDSVMGTQ